MSVHCWMGEDEHMQSTLTVDEYQAWARDPARQSVPDGTCMLPDGHDGPHKFTPDDQIVIQFGALDDAKEDRRG